ncbi:MAG: hypothetical protein ACOX3A_08970 [bacterium]
MPMMLGLVLPFNLIKGVMSSTATFLLYKKVRHFLRGEISTIRVGLQEERES